jgi:adenylosuccinate synthase
VSSRGVFTFPVRRLSAIAAAQQYRHEEDLSSSSAIFHSVLIATTAAAASLVFFDLSKDKSKTKCDASDTTTNATSKETNHSDSADIRSVLQRLSDRVSSLEKRIGVSSPEPTAPIAHLQSRPNAGLIDIVLGAQWGDEGKGKLVDILGGTYDICARVAGGSNAGHTIVLEGTKYKFHLLPSGILNKDTVCIIGNGVVVHIPSLLNELDDLTSKGVDISGRVFVSDRAHIVFDFHQQVDGLQETTLGRNKLGTTKKGIGPAYASKISRNGLRISDFSDWEYFEQRFRRLAAAHCDQYEGLTVDVEAQLEYYRTVAPRIKSLTLDTILYTNDQFNAGKRILVEGANATMLDIDFGTYPYVTSSNPSVGSVLTGLGVSPHKLRGIYGTVKAYCTRVGEGPFPTELSTSEGPGQHLSTVGAEYGTTTGRPRRTGWLDIPQMRFAAMINGFTSLCLTKIDVLTGLEEVKIAKAYKYNGEYLTTMPASLSVLSNVEVEYETLPGWTQDISSCRTFDSLPLNCQRYVLRCQELIGIPIRWIGVGPNRIDLIDRGIGWDLAAPYSPTEETEE